MLGVMLSRGGLYVVWQAWSKTNASIPARAAALEVPGPRRRDTRMWAAGTEMGRDKRMLGVGCRSRAQLTSPRDAPTPTLPTTHWAKPLSPLQCYNARRCYGRCHSGRRRWLWWHAARVRGKGFTTVGPSLPFAHVFKCPGRSFYMNAFGCTRLRHRHETARATRASPKLQPAKC